VRSFSYTSHRLTGETFANLVNSWSYRADGSLETLRWGSNVNQTTTITPAAVQGLYGLAVGEPLAVQTDPLGRTVRTVEAFLNFDPTATRDRTTEFTYDGSSHVLTRTARLPGNTRQTTQYLYGVRTSDDPTDPLRHPQRPQHQRPGGPRPAPRPDQRPAQRPCQ